MVVVVVLERIKDSISALSAVPLYTADYPSGFARLQRERLAIWDETWRRGVVFLEDFNDRHDSPNPFIKYKCWIDLDLLMSMYTNVCMYISISNSVGTNRLSLLQVHGDRKIIRSELFRLCIIESNSLELVKDCGFRILF